MFNRQAVKEFVDLLSRDQTPVGSGPRPIARHQQQQQQQQQSSRLAATGNAPVESSPWLVHQQQQQHPHQSDCSRESSGVDVIDPVVQRHLTHFSMVTHGFGGPAIMAAMSAVQNYLNELLKLTDRSGASVAPSFAGGYSAEYQLPAVGVGQDIGNGREIGVTAAQMFASQLQQQQQQPMKVDSRD